MPEPEAPATLAERFSLDDLIGGLSSDLRELRAGKISVRDAHARAVLAKQILRAVHYVVMAQKYMEGRAVPALNRDPDGQESGFKS